MGKNGMSLVEVVVSMLLLSLIVAGVAAVFSLAGKGPTTVGTLELEAANYARETLENLKNAVSTDPARSAPLTVGTDIADPLPDADFKNTYGGARTYTVEDVDSDTDGIYDYKRVTVTVKWNG